MFELIVPKTRGRAMLMILLAGMLFAAPRADAGLPTVEVNTLADENDGIGVGGISLRDAIAAVSPDGTITFQSGLMGTLTLTVGELAIDKNLTITGPGLELITISGMETFRIFTLSNSATVSISELTITLGGAPTGAGALVPQNCTLTMTGCDIIGNIASDSGGAFHVTDATLSLDDCVLQGNQAATVGGGILVASQIGAATLNVMGCFFDQNSTVFAGGAIFITEDGVVRPEALPTPDGNGPVGVTVTIDTSVFGNNSVQNTNGDGGAIYNIQGAVEINNCFFGENQAPDSGGAIYNSALFSDANLIVRDSAFFNNQSTNLHGGAINNIVQELDPGRPQPQGPIAPVIAELTVVNTTFFQNNCGGFGGAIHNNVESQEVKPAPSGPVMGSADAAVFNCTFASNQVNQFGFGAGGALANGSNFFVANSLLAANEAPQPIVNRPTPNTLPLVPNDAFGFYSSNGSNLLTTFTQSIGFQSQELIMVPVDQVVDLTDFSQHGGFSPNLLIVESGPAKDAGDNASVTDPPFTSPFTDQRGLPRIDNATVDIGAVELQGTVTPQPRLMVTPTSLNFGQVNVIGDFAEMNATLENIGDATLTFSGIGILGDTASFTFASVFDPNTTTLDPGSSIGITVCFDPVAVGVTTGVVQIMSNDPIEPTQNVPTLIGEGIAQPRLRITPTTINFGQVDVNGGFSDSLVTLENVGDATLAFTSIDIVGDTTEFSAILGFDPATQTLDPGGSITFTVRFDPTSSGFKNGNVQVVSNDPVEPTQNVPTLVGEGVIPPTAPQSIWYFAEGRREGNQETFLLVVNPSPQNTVDLELTIYFENANPVTVTDSVAPLARATFNMSQVLAGFPVDDFSFGMRLVGTVQQMVERGPGVQTITVNPAMIVCERSMFASPGGINRSTGNSNVGSLETNANWLVSEGSTSRGRETIVNVLNPTNIDALVRFTWLNERGDNVVRFFDVPANRKFSLASSASNPDADFSILVDSVIPPTRPQPDGANIAQLVVERAVYGGANGIQYLWSHSVLGLTATSTQWYFCDLQTDGSNESFVLLGNSGSSDIMINLEFFFPGGVGNFSGQLLVQANRRRTIHLERALPNELTDKTGFFLRASSADQFFAECAVYNTLSGFNDRSGGGAITGLTSPASAWFMAEGAAYGPSNFETLICVANPNDVPVATRVTFLPPPPAAPIVQNFTIPALERVTVNANDSFPSDQGTQSFSTQVESLTQGAGLLAERRMYVQGGHSEPRIEINTSTGVPIEIPQD